MPKLLILLCAASLLAACDARVNTAPPVTEKNTTIVNPPGAGEKKVESSTSVTNTTGDVQVEKKTTETTR